MCVCVCVCVCVYIYIYIYTHTHTWGFPRGASEKESTCQCRRYKKCGFHSTFHPRVRKIPGAGNGNPLLYSCLGNPMDREAWRATVHRVTKSWTRLSSLCMRTHTHTHTDMLIHCFSFNHTLWKLHLGYTRVKEPVGNDSEFVTTSHLTSVLVPL